MAGFVNTHQDEEKEKSQRPHCETHDGRNEGKRKSTIKQIIIVIITIQMSPILLFHVASMNTTFKVFTIIFEGFYLQIGLQILH